MGIAADDIEKIRAAVPITDVITQYVALRRVGRNWTGLCPFHAEKSPSFYVNDQTGRYKCFGCGAGGDVISFVREVEHTDFVGAMEHLAGKAGITLTFDTGTENRDRGRRKHLIEAMGVAVEWYHQRLLTAADARPAREYLRSRGLAGDPARKFKLGWAPDSWDTFVREAKLPADVLRDTSLAFTNSRGGLNDFFRGRVLFPIFNENGDPVAFGGRVLPGSSDPAKYKNSPETPIYTKSRTLYGLNWAKATVVSDDQVVVCEGYTDVIGFHRAGVQRAVATCGTALTEEHVRLLTRFSRNIVLSFDADGAGQGAAERFYEWERKYEVAVSVARLPAGKDPADLAGTDPEGLSEAVRRPLRFLEFRLDRALGRADLTTIEGRVRAAEAALTVIAEHPNELVRQEYAASVAVRCGLPPADLVDRATRRSVRVVAPPEPARRSERPTAETTALALLVHQWDAVAPWLSESLFSDATNLAAFRALAEADGDVHAAIEAAEPAVAELLGRVAVEEPDNDPVPEAFHLIAVAAEREVTRLRTSPDLHDAARIGAFKEAIDEVRSDGPRASEAAARLLGWIDRIDEVGA